MTAKFTSQNTSKNTSKPPTRRSLKALPGQVLLSPALLSPALLSSALLSSALLSLAILSLLAAAYASPLCPASANEVQKAVQKPAREAPKPASEAQKPTTEAQKPAAEAQKPAVVAQQSAAPVMKPVLNPEKFFGQAKLGYMAAKACPEICEKLFCYCGCDLTDDHSTLLDCFVTDHGVDCHICQQEAFIALKMKREGKPLGEIQKAVDIAFEKQYPFDEISPALQKYIDNRQWKDTRPKSKSGDASARDKVSAEAARKGMSGDSTKASQASTGQSSGTTVKASQADKRPPCCGGKKKSEKTAK